MSQIAKRTQTPSNIRIIRIVAVLVILLLAVVLALVYFLQPHYTALQEGKLAYLQGRYQDAGAAFNRAISEDDANSEYYIARGLNYIQLGNAEGAISDFKTAIALDPNGSTRPYEQLSIISLIRKNYQDAIDYSGHIIDITKDNAIAARAYYSRGSAYAGLKDNETALENFKKATELDPSVPEYFQRLGDIYYALDRMGDALNSYNTYLSMASPDAIATASYVQDRVGQLRGK